MNGKTLCVIGGGASGMAAATEAARYAKNHKLDIKIVIFEKLPKVGKKILATGNGRCNILNSEPAKDKFFGNRKVINSVLDKYTVESNVEFFMSLGLYLTHEADGRLYPLSLQASSVLDALRFELERLNVEIICDTPVTSISRKGNGFLLNDEIYADSVIIAGGGKSSSVHGSDGSAFNLLSSMGIRIKPTFPALTAVKLKNKDGSLKGVRAHGEIMIVENGKVVASDSGEIQYTEYGISGIPVMNISRHVAEHFQLHKKGKIIAAINTLPDFLPEEIFSYIVTRSKSNPELLCENLLSGLMPKKLGISKLRAAGIAPESTVGTLTKNHIAVLTEVINSQLFEISGTLGFDNSQVTAGGADTSFFNPSTLECEKINGLFACGEVLDVDAVCGGYNLTWAWSSGRCAGYNAIKNLSEKTDA
ncbi:MAG: aminoacetone oxidase family FAD-binding enzyme [Clostridia bacterium]|nr:aminoacetone oxidase family FAD-binding enzyme [Clostridia bacterium]